MIDEDNLMVTFYKLKTFLNGNRATMRGARSYYKSKGILSFGSTKYSISQDLPMFILNYSTASDLQAYTGKNVYSSISGFGLEFQNEMDLIELLEKLQNFKVKNDTDKLELGAFELENNQIQAQIRYVSDYAGTLIGDNRKIARKITIDSTANADAFLVTCELESSGDFNAAKRYFEKGSFGLPHKVLNFTLEELQNTKKRHERILEAVNSIKTIELTAKGNKSTYELMGTCEDYADKAQDLESTTKEVKYLKKPIKFLCQEI